jgi:hypothetical protein
VTGGTGERRLCALFRRIHILERFFIFGFKQAYRYCKEPIESSVRQHSQPEILRVDQNRGSNP